MAYRVEFVDWAEVTGDSTEGAIIGVSQGDERVLSAVVRVTRTLMTTEGLTSEQLRELLPNRAIRLVSERAEQDPSWVEQHRGQTEVAVMISEPHLLA